MITQQRRAFALGFMVAVLLLPAAWYVVRMLTRTPEAFHEVLPTPAKVVIAKANQNASRLSCQMNLKQIALGMMQYVQDYNEMHPPANKWCDVTQIYIKSEKILNCPSLEPDKRYGYAMNWKLSRKNMASVWAPSQTVQLYESSVLERNHFGEGKDLAFRHSVGANYAYVDGHVKWHPQDKPQNFRLSSP